MSYSRWGNSRWYTFWSDLNIDGVILDQKARRRKKYQVFEICSTGGFYYHQLVKDMEACIAEVKKKEPSATEEELEELRGYMREFIKDMDEEESLLP